MNQLLVGWRPYVIAAVVIGALAALVLVLQAPDKRPGDPAVYDRISNSNCGELRDLADPAVWAATDADAPWSAYVDAANQRMKELHCFD